jgi:hypothetical protein
MWAAPLGYGVYTPQLQSFPVATVKCFERIDLHAFSMNDNFLTVESMRDPGWQKMSHFMPDFTSSAQEAAQAAAQISRE